MGSNTASSYVASAVLDGSFLFVPKDHYGNESNRVVHGHGGNNSVGGGNSGGGSSNTDNRSIKNLLSTLQTLSSENTSLLLEIESLKSSQLHRSDINSRISGFKKEYELRFISMKGALDKFRTNYPDVNNPTNVTTAANAAAASDATNATNATNATYTNSNTVSSEKYQELLNQLKKEKEESTKKDNALRKYEAFYKEVKARSKSSKSSNNNNNNSNGNNSSSNNGNYSNHNAINPNSSNRMLGVGGGGQQKNLMEKQHVFRMQQHYVTQPQQQFSNVQSNNHNGNHNYNGNHNGLVRVSSTTNNHHHQQQQQQQNSDR
jgi:hypothetical protein